MAAQTLDLATDARAQTQTVTGVDSTDGLIITLAPGTSAVLLYATHACSWRWNASDDLVPLPVTTWFALPGLAAGGLAASTRLEVRADSSSAAVSVAVA